MRVKVRVMGRLTDLLGSELDVELSSDAKIRDLIAKLKEKAPMLDEEALTRYVRDEPELTILLNGKNIHMLEALRTPLKDGDIVVLLPPVVGGNRK
ncbi:MAG: MoaD family protein [Candidatus Bathyarchaeota archaeon B63]|nr:MAG: MoaD family protein [Candidatus Bathyarchaeota archaeon B63]